MPQGHNRQQTNCINCGAVLHGNVCEYCGTEYGSPCKTDVTDSNTELYVETVRRFAAEHHLDPKQMVGDLRDFPGVVWNPQTLSFTVPHGTHLEFRGENLLIYQEQREASKLAGYFSPSGWRRRR